MNKQEKLERLKKLYGYLPPEDPTVKIHHAVHILKDLHPTATNRELEELLKEYFPELLEGIQVKIYSTDYSTSFRKYTAELKKQMEDRLQRKERAK